MRAPIAKSIPCLRIFSWFFRSSHSNSISRIYTNCIHNSKGMRSAEGGGFPGDGTLPVLSAWVPAELCGHHPGGVGRAILRPMPRSGKDQGQVLHSYFGSVSYHTGLDRCVLHSSGLCYRIPPAVARTRRTSKTMKVVRLF